MKGASAEPSVKMISRLIINIVRIMGGSHHFLRVRRKPQISPSFDLCAI